MVEEKDLQPIDTVRLTVSFKPRLHDHFSEWLHPLCPPR
jgi:hypothetical protein